MKKKPCTLIIKAVLLLFLTLPSCKKVEDASSTNNRDMSNLRVVSECYSDIDVVCDGILRFDNIDHYENTIDCIDESHETWNADFEAIHDFIDDDQWNQLVDSLNFIEDQPYFDFDKYFKIKSYFSYIDSLDRVWYDVYNCDSLHDPDLFDLIGDDAEALLFNREMEIMIGDSLFKFYSDGTVIAIYGMDCNTLKAIRLDSSNAAHYSNVVRHPSPPLDPVCSRQGEEPRNIYYGTSGEYKIKCQHKMTNFFITKEKAKTKSQKKKSNGKWRKWATSLYIRIEGYEYGPGCVEQPYDIDVDKDKNRKKLKIKYKSPLMNGWFIAIGANKSTHQATKSTYIYGLDSLYITW